MFWIVRTHSSQPAKTGLYDCGLCVTARMVLQGLFHVVYSRLIISIIKLIENL